MRQLILFIVASMCKNGYSGELLTAPLALQRSIPLEFKVREFKAASGSPAWLASLTSDVGTFAYSTGKTTVVGRLVYPEGRSAEPTNWSWASIDGITLSPSGQWACLTEADGRFCVADLQQDRFTDYWLPAVVDNKRFERGGLDIIRLNWLTAPDRLAVTYRDGRIVLVDPADCESHTIVTSQWKWERIPEIDTSGWLRTWTDHTEKTQYSNAPRKVQVTTLVTLSGSSYVVDTDTETQLWSRETNTMLQKWPSWRAFSFKESGVLICNRVESGLHVTLLQEQFETPIAEWRLSIPTQELKNLYPVQIREVGDRIAILLLGDNVRTIVLDKVTSQAEYYAPKNPSVRLYPLNQTSWTLSPDGPVVSHALTVTDRNVAVESSLVQMSVLRTVSPGP